MSKDKIDQVLSNELIWWNDAYLNPERRSYIVDKLFAVITKGASMTNYMEHLDERPKADAGGMSLLAQVESALVLAEDVLSRSPHSTAIWANGVHPYIGITKIRDAIAALRTPARCDGEMNTWGELNTWIEREFAGYSIAMRRKDDTPIPGEPLMSMAVAKELTRAAVIAFTTVKRMREP